MHFISDPDEVDLVVDCITALDALWWEDAVKKAEEARERENRKNKRG